MKKINIYLRNFLIAIAAVSLLSANTAFAYPFLTAVNYSVGTSPKALIFADFDEDGKQDIAVANLGSANVSILIGNGDGTFDAAVNYTVGTDTYALVSSDFDEDGNVDIATVNNGSSNVSILLGNGDGTFDAKVDYAVGSSPVGITVADFDEDNNQDIAVTNAGDSDISILIGNGDGTFDAKVDYASAATPVGIIAYDFDEDNNLDIAAATQSDNVSILIGNGDGTFDAKVDYAAGVAALGIAIADLDGDSNQDVVVSNESDNDISIFLGNGDGTFDAKVDYAAGTSPNGVGIYDFNGDGNRDIAVANNGGTNISILLSVATAAASSSGRSDNPPKNPYPTIYDLSTFSVDKGSGQIKITLIGADFLSGSDRTSVFFNSNKLNIEITSPTKILATIPSEYLSESGIYEIYASNPGPGGGDSDIVRFAVVEPQKTEQPVDSGTTTPAEETSTPSIFEPIKPQTETEELSRLQTELSNLIDEAIRVGIEVSTETKLLGNHFKSLFTKNLSFGSIDEEVRSLQKFLNYNGFIVRSSGLGSLGNETNYFGPATQSALSNFQKANNIALSFGNLGPITRALIESLSE